MTTNEILFNYFFSTLFVILQTTIVNHTTFGQFIHVYASMFYKNVDILIEFIIVCHLFVSHRPLYNLCSDVNPL